MRTRKLSICISIIVFAGSVTAAGNWPTWRHDATRTAATSHRLPDDLNLQWQRQLAKPRPSFPNQPRMCADRYYEPIAAAGLLFVPSMITDSVTAYNADTGVVAWRFITGGPIRFAPVYFGGSLYFGSDDGYVYCVEAQTGKLLWKKRAVPDDRGHYRLFGNERCISRWPVRGAPIVHDGTLYFGSGVWPSEGIYVFAVDASSGDTKWINKEILSIKNGFNDHGRHYSAALPPLGYFSIINDKLVMTSGRCFPAFFDLKTGKLAPYTSGYGKCQDYPKGYWYATGIADRLYCSGHIYALDDGLLRGRPPKWVTQQQYKKYSGMSEKELSKLLDKNAFVTKQRDGQLYIDTSLPPGVTEVGFGHRNVTPNEKYFIDHFEPLNIDPENRSRDVGALRWRVLTDDTVYFSALTDISPARRERGALTHIIDEYDRIVAHDLTEADWRITKAYGPGQFPPGWRSNRSKLIHWRRRFPKEKWSMQSSLKVHIKAGERLYAGKPGAVAAIQLPDGKTKPRIAWSEEISGTPARMIAANHRLFVVTKMGTTYCFGPSGTDPKKYEHETASETVNDRWTDIAASYLADRPGPVRGYCLVYGWNSGRLARGIANQSNMQVIVLEEDGATVADARDQLINDNLYGYDIHVIHTAPSDINLPPYFAGLIASEKPIAGSGKIRDALLKQITSALHPHCGKAYLPVSGDGQVDAVSQFFNERGLSGYKISNDGNICRISRISPPEGSAEWTHEAADAANTFATDDPHARPPLGTLWFSGSIDRYFLPPWDYAHNRNPYPVVSNGRMYLLVANRVYAADIYTGEYLWQKSLSETGKTRRRRRYHRKFSRPWYDNIVVNGDRLYVLNDHDCRILDAVDGKSKGKLPLPEKDDAGSDYRWHALRIADGDVFANVGTDIVRMDAPSGDVIWRHSGSKKWIAFAVGAGKVFCIDYYPPLSVAGQKQEADEAVLYALDAASGDRLWGQQLTVPELSEKEHKAASREFKASAATLKPIISYNAAHDLAIAIVNRNRVRVFAAETGEPAWKKQLPRTRPNATLFELEPPVVLSDALITDSGRVLNVTTGRTMHRDIFRGKRGCGRAVANQHIVTFRDADEAIVDLNEKRKRHISCIRSGCTNAMLPVGGILTGFDTAHGCVCNWSLFLSHALYQMPEVTTFEPGGRCITQYEQFAADLPADIDAYSATGGSIAEYGRNGMILDSEWKTTGYALKKAEAPLTEGEFRFVMKSAPGKSKPGRYTNGFFVFGPCEDADGLITCGIYYGRGTFVITGDGVEDATLERSFHSKKTYNISISFNLEKRQITGHIGDKKLTAKITGDIDAIRYYGYKTANTATIFSGIAIK